MTPEIAAAGTGRPTLSAAAKAWLLALALFLCLPAALMALQSDDALRSFHNRVLAGWPRAGSFRRDPAGYFAAASRWLADRTYPIIAATYGRNNFVYFALGETPAANITVAPRGFVFLNGVYAEYQDNLIEGACVVPADAAMRARIEAALVRLADIGRRRGTPIDVVMVPTVPPLYGDRLPRSIPARLRAACAEGPAGRAPLSLVRAPEGFHFVYPFDAMSALRDDPAMFPFGDFHPNGLSVETVTASYLRAVGAAAPAGVSIALTAGPSEVLGERGVEATFAHYEARGSAATSDDDAGAALAAAAQPFRDAPGEPVYVYRNPTAPNARTALVLSDSYGYNQALSLAAAFRTVVQTRAPERDLAAMVRAVGAAMPFDRIVLVFNDANFGRVIGIADMLAAPAGG